MSDDSNRPVLTNRWAKEMAVTTVSRPFCNCLDREPGDERKTELKIHAEFQDTTCLAWKRLEELIEQAARDGREEFSPGRQMTPEQWSEIATLPANIAKLKAVKRLILYGSSLLRIPPEIGEMSSLEEFTPYTSYQLHWFPYEITRCRNLKQSVVSTRAIYGNFKNRLPFPKLPQQSEAHTPDSCSVCKLPFGDTPPLQYWVSLRIATDVLPLLVHACSTDCLATIPAPPDGYIPTLHQGGLAMKQPPSRW